MVSSDPNELPSYEELRGRMGVCELRLADLVLTALQRGRLTDLEVHDLRAVLAELAVIGSVLQDSVAALALRAWAAAPSRMLH